MVAFGFAGTAHTVVTVKGHRVLLEIGKLPAVALHVVADAVNPLVRYAADCLCAKFQFTYLRIDPTINQLL